MGIGFTVDSPLRLAHLGISSVMSLVDEFLVEKLREHYLRQKGKPFEKIKGRGPEARVAKITAWLNFVDETVKENFIRLKESPLEDGSEIVRYLELLPEDSELKAKYRLLQNSDGNFAALEKEIREGLVCGSADVNIMTKLDRDFYGTDGEVLPIGGSDALLALKGFAESTLESSIILSAGLNMRLYSYMAGFPDFFPDKNGKLKKKVILKVSDLRSAMVQGRFLAKKGIHVSEYRMESGLNCGGHAFASDGTLMGPVLAELRDGRQNLIDSTWKLLSKALKQKGISCGPLPVKITAQGGIGTKEEQHFLMDHYKLDATGWGSPFLLVPEVANVDRESFAVIRDSCEEDLYLSGISPVGVPFNTVRGNTKEREKQKLIAAGKPGSACPIKHLVSSTEFTEKPICTASARYQKKKLRELEDAGLPPDELENKKRAILAKECICVGLGTPALLVHNLDTKTEGTGVSICPGPNMAYFNREYSLEELVGHIYGRNNVMDRPERSHMFLKELTLYVDYIESGTKELSTMLSEKDIAGFASMREKMQTSIEYYRHLLSEGHPELELVQEEMLSGLQRQEERLGALVL